MYRELGNDEALIVIQEWDSRTHWEEHLRSDEFAVVIGAMSLLQKPDTVEFQVLDQLDASCSVKEIRARHFKKQGDHYEFSKNEEHPREDEFFTVAQRRQERARRLGTAGQRGAAT
jgi:hypothetical protein